jgi:uncharacterized membrane protein
MTARPSELGEREAPPAARPDSDRIEPEPFAVAWAASFRALIVLVALVSSQASARAEFRVCNNTRSLVNLAVGLNAGEDFVTEGWWIVTPGSCATPIKAPLKGRYVYLYATDIDGADMLKGSVSMCIDRGKFKVYGIENCWRRGLLAVTFAEIDTLDSPDWTTFLTEPKR